MMTFLLLSAFAQLNPLLCSIVRGLFNKARVGALTFFGLPKIFDFQVGKDPPLVSVRMSPRDPGTLASANNGLLRIASRAYSTL